MPAKPRPAFAWVLSGVLSLFGPLGLVVALAGCAVRNAEPPRYKPLAELDQCYPGECVEAELGFRRWANAEYYRGRMPYHCDPGSELDGRPDPNITRMIFVVHGVVGASPESIAQLHLPPGLMQLRNVINALRRAQKLDRQVDPGTIAIIAPNFQQTKSWAPWTDEDPRMWTWGGSSYPVGTLAEPRESKSGTVKADAVSSFDVMDEFLRAAIVKFPNLEDVVIVGHSAGAQFVHRYVWMGVGVHEQLEAAGVHLRYVPANPGAYAFPIWQRKTPPGRNTVPRGPGRGDTQDWRWITPNQCKGWDEWGYGLAQLDGADGDRPMRAANYAIDHYLRPQNRALARRALAEPGSPLWDRAARQALTLMYASREVWHIQAASDHENTYSNSCATALQGRSRYERFSNFQEAWTTRLGITAPNLHFVALEDVSPHSSRVVYASDAGVHLLFH